MTAAGFQSDHYLLLPNGAVIARVDLRPCPCGEIAFKQLRNVLGRTRTVCSKCIKTKPDEYVTAIVSMTGTVEIVGGDPPMSIARREAYARYIRSPEWAEKRAYALSRSGGKCQRCTHKTGLEVHHRHYRSLGNEQPEDLEVLCKACHQQADREREIESAEAARQKLYDARLEGWASKKYGDNWPDDVAEEFHAWLDRQ